MTDPAGELRAVAEDLQADAAGFDTSEPHDRAVVEGLGRAAGRIEARADKVERGGDSGN